MSKINNFPQRRELYQIAAPRIKRGVLQNPNALSGKSVRPIFHLSKHGSSAAPIAAQGNKTVLVLDGQAEANGAARFFVSREDEVRVRRRGETRRVEAETWHRPRRSLRPEAKATLQIAQRAIAPPTVSWFAPVGANLRLRQ